MTLRPTIATTLLAAGPQTRRKPWTIWIMTLGLLAGCATLPVPQTTPSDPIQIASERRTTEDGPQHWTVVRLDLTRLRLAVTPGTGHSPHEFHPRTTTAALQATPTARLAINASFYAIPPASPDATPGSSRGATLDSVGLVMAGGRIYSPPDSTSRIVTAVLCIAPDRVMIETATTCTDPSVQDAVAAGPALLRDGIAPTPALQSDFAVRRHPRSAIALSADATTAWLVVVDGRQTGSIGATLPELVAFLTALGADDALNLDGGGSTALAYRDTAGGVRLLNMPIDGGIPGRERAVATHILVLPADAQSK